MSNRPTLNDEEIKKLSSIDEYILSNKYDIKWIIENQMGSNCLWLTEALTKVIPFSPKMRILDLGCGKAISSIFLAKEFGVQVWAVDPFIKSTDNYTRIKEANVSDKVFPLQCDARNLPFPEEFFDVIIGINSYQFYGTDDIYLRHKLVKLVKQDGYIGMIIPGFYKELTGELPQHLQENWNDFLLASWHSPEWYQKNLERSDAVDIELIDTIGKLGYEFFLRWEKIIGDTDISFKDKGENITFVRFVVKRK
ncbi:MAG: SAM-dependent methyltransferase [Candidatus Thorarchaeota archaeon]